ncbi:histidine kinase [Streptomyces sp. NPDC055051]
MSLYGRIFLLNAAVFVLAAGLLLGPVTVSTPVLLGEAVVVVCGLVLMLVLNAALLRVGLAPLGRLRRAMATADLLKPGARPEVTGRGEIADLTGAFNAMLDRLESERATSSGRVLTAQEAERQRIARELHDEVGQTLTAVLLQLKHTADHAPRELREDLRQAQETTRASLEEIRRIARRLRPGVLEELGLHSALRSLAGELSTPGLRVTTHLASGAAPPVGVPGGVLPSASLTVPVAASLVGPVPDPGPVPVGDLVPDPVPVRGPVPAPVREPLREPVRGPGPEPVRDPVPKPTPGHER